MNRARGFLLLWCAALAATWLLRPLLPPDETRYLAVAWEMHSSGSFLVPVLNGEAYSHKPPLLFWAYAAGFEMFGPNSWWPRLVQAAGAALALALVARLARALAPQAPDAPPCAALLLGGTLAFQVYSGALFFDLWLTAFVLAAWLGLVRACPADPAQPPSPRTGWLLFALATAAALLTKGPAALISILPPALLRVFWRGRDARPAATWSALFLALAAGAGLALAWALPAAHAGGPEYGAAILWGQTAGRLQESFAHARPFWWYLTILPVLALPWTLWPPLWRRSPGASATAVRFGLSAFLPALLIFSCVSGKQPHYLLPALAALALIGAARLCAGARSAPRLWLPGALLLGAGLLAALPWILTLARLPAPDFARSAWFGGAAALTLGAAAVILARRSGPAPGLAGAALLMPALALLLHLAAGGALAAHFDLAAPSRIIAEAQRSGRATALLGTGYHGQFHFLGRLKDPVANPAAAGEMRVWLHAHPDGLAAVVVRSGDDPRLAAGAESIHQFGTRRLALWRAGALAEFWPPRAATRAP